MTSIENEELFLYVREQAIRFVGSSDSLLEAYERFQQTRLALKGGKFMIASDGGAGLNFATNIMLSGSFVVRGLFGGKGLSFFDEETMLEMDRNGKFPTKIPLDYSISLDTQTVSYLEPHLTGRANVPREFASVFSFIARDDVDVNPIPYKLENFFRLRKKNIEDLDKIFSKIKSYEVLRTLDTKHYLETGTARSHLNEAELITRTQSLMSQWMNESEDIRVLRYLTAKFRTFYAILLKISTIQFCFQQLELSKKIESLLLFFDETLRDGLNNVL